MLHPEGRTKGMTRIRKGWSAPRDSWKALIAKHQDLPTMAMVTLATAGPTTRAMLNMIELERDGALQCRRG